MSKQFYTKIDNKVIELFEDGFISIEGLSLYMLLSKQSKKFSPSKAWILNNGFSRYKLEKSQKELEKLDLLWIKKGKGGHDYSKYYVRRMKSMSDYVAPVKQTISTTEDEYDKIVWGSSASHTPNDPHLLIKELINKKNDSLNFEIIEKENLKTRPKSYWENEAKLWIAAHKQMGNDSDKDTVENIIAYLVKNMIVYNKPLDYFRGVRMFLVWQDFWKTQDTTIYNFAKYHRSLFKQYEAQCLKDGNIIPRFANFWKMEQELAEL